MQRSEVKTTVLLDGALTVAVADAVKTKIIGAFGESRAIEIDVSGATDIDLSVLQIFLAARKMAKTNGGEMVVLRSERLVNELGRCGIPAAAVCHEIASL